MACFCRLKRQYRDFSPDCPAGDAAGAESFYREIKKMLAENREWVHFGLEWEDQYILRHCELL